MGESITRVPQRDVGRTVREIRLAPAAGSDPTRGRRLRVGPLLALALLVILAVSVRLATRRRVPQDPVRPQVVEPFSLFDTRGQVHDRAGWRDARAVVLFLIGTHCPTTDGFAPEMRRLAERYGPAGVLFFGLHVDPATPADAVARFARGQRLAFPILLDPAHELAADLGLRVTPAAALLDGQGHLLYSGRIDDRFASAGKARRARPAQLRASDRRGARRIRAACRTDRGIGHPAAAAPAAGRIKPDDHLP